MTGIVDYQTHWHPQSYLERLRQRDDYPRAIQGAEPPQVELGPDQLWRTPPGLFDIERSLDDMDRHGISTMVSSPIFFGGYAGLSEDEAVEASRFLNRETARMQGEIPDRFVGLAMVPMQYPNIAAEAIREAADLGLRGACVLTNYADRGPATGEHLRIYRAMDDADMTCVLHPAMRSRVWQLNPSDPVERGLNWMFDTAHLALSIIENGILDECPTLTVLHPHLGGVLPYVSGRLRVLATGDIANYAHHRFFVDTASSTPGALEVAIDFYGADRIVFATDDPFVPRQATMGFFQREVAEPLRRSILENQVLGLVP